MNRIGFMHFGEKQESSSTESPVTKTEVPVKSLVKVRFYSEGKELAYYNDKFFLKEGDVVYVGGKMAGVPGIVTTVTTKFRIHTSDYQKVLAKLDLEFHGHFVRVQDKMMEFPDCQ